jgi:hypothetical protein
MTRISMSSTPLYRPHPRPAARRRPGHTCWSSTMDSSTGGPLPWRPGRRLPRCGGGDSQQRRDAARDPGTWPLIVPSVQRPDGESRRAGPPRAALPATCSTPGCAPALDGAPITHGREHAAREGTNGLASAATGSCRARPTAARTSGEGAAGSSRANAAAAPVRSPSRVCGARPRWRSVYVARNLRQCATTSGRRPEPRLYVSGRPTKSANCFVAPSCTPRNLSSRC